MNIYDEVTKLPRQHRLVLCQFILRTISPSYDEKIRLLGRVPTIALVQPTLTAAEIEQALITKLNEQRRPETKPWIARRHQGISKDAIA